WEMEKITKIEVIDGEGYVTCTIKASRLPSKAVEDFKKNASHAEKRQREEASGDSQLPTPKQNGSPAAGSSEVEDNENHAGEE
ncbi:MAG: hypothetical protein Q9198_000014, partial [Flavoplaca austrocitrina]